MQGGISMYIPLYNKSNYTLLSSLIKIDDLINYAEKNNISSLALTDTTMYGTMEFITKCRNKNIKPIIGLDVILENYNLVLYAKDYQGYRSLIKLSTIQNERQVTADDLKKYNENIIAILKVIPTMIRGVFYEKGSGDYPVGDVPFMRM